MSTAPRILCVAGSPRRGGNSDRLLDSFVSGVEQAGGTTIRVVATEAGVAPCRGCNVCSRTGECVIRDGMDAFRAQLDSADALVVSTPVYFATVPATLKALYDRLQPYWAFTHALGRPPLRPKRPATLLVVGGGGDPFGTGCVVTPSRSALAVAGFSVEEVVEVVGPDSAGDVERFSEALARVCGAGADLVDRVTP